MVANNYRPPSRLVSAHSLGGSAVCSLEGYFSFAYNMIVGSAIEVRWAVCPVLEEESHCGAVTAMAQRDGHLREKRVLVDGVYTNQ